MRKYDKEFKEKSVNLSDEVGVKQAAAQHGAVDKVPLFLLKYGKIGGTKGAGEMQGILGPMQLSWELVLIENLVPQDHLVQKLDTVLDLDFIYEETQALYSKIGRPGIDPVVLVKFLLIGYLFGIPSERQIEWRIQTDFALRWYLGLSLSDPVPDHSTISQNRRRRPSFRKVFRRLFEEVVRQCVEAGLVNGRVVGTDSTHVKACASRASEYLTEVEEEPGVYWELRPDMSEPQTVKTLIHEIAHAKLHDLSPAGDQVFGKPVKDRRTSEVEAESVAYVVCQHFGIETSGYSFGYIASWSKGRELAEVKASLDCIRETAAMLIEGVERLCEKQKPNKTHAPVGRQRKTAAHSAYVR